jgi:hypothetical protein
MEDFIRVCVPDPAEDSRVGEAPLHSMVAIRQGVTKRREVDLEWLDASKVVLA